MGTVYDIIRPGFFSRQVAADGRRMEFDYRNEVIVINKVPVDFVFIGDSITHLWELNAYFTGKSGLVLNRGIGGDTTEYALKRLEADAIQLKPKYIVSLIGINNSWCTSGDFMGNKGTPVEPVIDQIVSDIAEMAALSKKNNIQFIICSILPTNAKSLAEPHRINEVVCGANARLKKLALENNLIYVDYFSHFVSEDGKTLKDGLTYDGCHPHVAGYNLMAKILKETLSANGIEI